MRPLVVLTLTLTIGLAALPISSAPTAAAAEAENVKLSLATDYLFEAVHVAKPSRGGHWLRLSVTLDNKGRGKGTLEIDPNTQGHNSFGDPTSVTEIATHSTDITLDVVQVDDPTRKGRRLYEIKGHESHARLFLVVSQREAEPNRLIVHSKERVHVLPLKDATKANKLLSGGVG